MDCWGGLVASSYKHGNERSGVIKCGEFLHQLRNCKLLEEDCAPWSCNFRMVTKLGITGKSMDRGCTITGS